MAIVLSFQTSCILAHVLSMMGTGFPSILMEKLMEKRWRPDESVPSSVVAWKSSVLFKQGDDRFLPASIPGPRAVESFRKEGNPWFRQKNRLDFNIASRSFLRKPSLILSVYHWRTNDVPALLPGQWAATQGTRNNEALPMVSSITQQMHVLVALAQR